MTSFTELVNQSASNAWLYIPTAVLLGALHGLEPGHSKTMMAAFVIAIRGTVFQAILLGLSAAFSHSLVIWALAAAALHYGGQWNAESTEPYFQMVSGVIIIGLAVWMFLRTRRDAQLAEEHDHSHADEGIHGGQLVETAHGLVEVSVFETDVPPRFRLYFYDKNSKAIALPDEKDVALEIFRPEGPQQTFSFVNKGSFLEATDILPEPHEFKGHLLLQHEDHSHASYFRFKEHHHHHEGIDVSDGDYQDAHEKAHAADIMKRFTNRNVTTAQIIIFGLTGGLLPCPAAFTILLVCLQLKQFTLGFSLVLCFSLGLAITLVASGALAAWGVHHASKKIKGFSNFARKAPYVSSILLIILGLYVSIQGWLGR